MPIQTRKRSKTHKKKMKHVPLVLVCESAARRPVLPLRRLDMRLMLTKESYAAEKKMQDAGEDEKILTTSIRERSAQAKNTKCRVCNYIRGLKCHDPLKA